MCDAGEEDGRAREANRTSSYCYYYYYCYCFLAGKTLDFWETLNCWIARVVVVVGIKIVKQNFIRGKIRVRLCLGGWILIISCIIIIVIMRICVTPGSVLNGYIHRDSGWLDKHLKHLGLSLTRRDRGYPDDACCYILCYRTIHKVASGVWSRNWL